MARNDYSIELRSGDALEIGTSYGAVSMRMMPVAIDLADVSFYMSTDQAQLVVDALTASIASARARYQKKEE